MTNLPEEGAHRPNVACAATLLLMIVATGATEDAAAQSRRVYRDLTLVDGSGGPPVEGARVGVMDGRFTCVSGPDGCPLQPGDEDVSLAGAWLLPGLIDAHVHLPVGADPTRAELEQRLRFALGITTVRDAGSGALEELLAYTRVSEAADAATPRIVPSAEVLPEYAARYGVDRGPELVERLVDAGVRAIKIKEPFDDDVWLRSIERSRELGVPSYGHYWTGPPPTVYADAAIDAGISGLSHLMGVAPLAQPPGADLNPPEGVRAFWPEFWAWRADLWLTADPGALDAFADRLVERDVWLEPLLASEYYWLTPLPPGEFSFVTDVPRPLRERLRRTARNDDAAGEAAYPEPYRLMERFVASVADRGGTLVAGSDGAGLPGVPGLDLHEEIRLLRRAGLGADGSLRAATSDAAAALGSDDVGRIAVGALADALVYTSDPLSRPGGLLHPARVIKGGVEYDGAQLLRAARDAYGEYADGIRRRNAWICALSGMLAIAVALGALFAMRTAVGRRSARATAGQ